MRWSKSSPAYRSKRRNGQRRVCLLPFAGAGDGAGSAKEPAQGCDLLHVVGCDPWAADASDGGTGRLQGCAERQNGTVQHARAEQGPRNRNVRCDMTTDERLEKIEAMLVVLVERQ